MAIISGFFRSVAGDRKYTVDFLAQWVRSFISNGVYNGDFAVTAGANMQIVLPVGQAWINGYYCRNDGDVTLPIANADGILKRKDTVILRWDINTRNITAQILTGTFASSPIAPAIVRNVEQYDLKLAEIDIAAGAVSITQSAITDTRLDNNVCGIVHAVVDHIDTTMLFNQLQTFIAEHEAQFTADMAAFETQSSTDFNTWVNGIKDILDENTAATLLNMITAHTSNTDNSHEVTAEQTGAVPNTRKVNNKELSADITITPTDIGLGSVNNTADANKSVNYAGTAGSAKSPYALTPVVGNGGSTTPYDGSSAQTISIPKLTLSTTATPAYTLATGELYLSST